MLTWSKPNAIVPDEPFRWILTTLRFYAIVASVGIALAFAVISILAGVDRIEGGRSTMVLVALIVLFGAATYFTGRLYGTVGYVACTAGFVVVCVMLAVLGG